MSPKILIIPARRHVAEAYSEYLIRYLGDEFDIQMGYPTLNNPSPLAKDADKFDLIYPHFDSHWFLEPQEKYAHKIVHVYFEPQKLSKYKVALEAGTSKPVMEKLGLEYELRFGVDTELFKPFPQPKDDLFHIGFMGNIQTPRRYLKELFMPLKDLQGVKLDLYPMSWSMNTRDDEIERMGGQAVLDNIVDGDKWWPGLPNLYNRMDIYVRCDIDPGYQFSLLEVAACGIPVITTDPGLGKELADAGGGIYVECKDGDWSELELERVRKELRKEVEFLQNATWKRKEMGNKGRKFIVENYTWDKWIPKWREFFREGLKNAKKM